MKISMQCLQKRSWNQFYQCVICDKLVHKRCSGISEKLTNNVEFSCKRCLKHGFGRIDGG